MQETQDKLESKGEELSKKLPQLPENGKKMLVEWMPWLSLVFGLLGLWAAWALWRLYDVASPYVEFANEISRVYGGDTVAYDKGLGFWISLLGLVAVAGLEVLAFSGLKARSKSKGWNLVFYAQILSLVVAVLSVVLSVDGYGLAGTLIGAAIGFYLLFQIKSYYKDAK